MRQRLTIAVLALLVPLVPLHAQEEGTPPPLFVDTVDVDVINVEVFVTDKGGHPVADLEVSDFEVYEDGKPVEITNFFASTRADRVAESLDELAPEAPVPALRPLPEEQQLNLMVYVDHFNLRPEDRKRVLADLEGFLEDRLIQGDRIMLVGHNRKVEVEVPFTQDRQAIFDGLERMSKKATHRPIADAELRRVMRSMTAIATDDSPRMIGQMQDTYSLLRAYVQSTRSELRLSARALRETVRSLAGAPGRKAVLYVSSGLAQRPGEMLYQHLADLFDAQALQSEAFSGEVIDPSIEAIIEDESHLFNQITREANSHQVTFYTLDARGPGGASTVSAEFGLLSTSDAGRTQLDQIRTHNLQEPLIDMAFTTGGRSILDTYNFDGVLGRVGEDFDSFYSLGYRPPSGRDGSYHKIEVKVKRPGLKARHRTGYESKPDVERVADRTLSSLLLGMEKNPLAVEVVFGKPEKKGGGKFDLPVLIRVPIDQITLLFQETSAEGRLRFFVVVQDDDGISDMHRQDYPVSIPADQIENAKGRELGYRATLRIRKGTPAIAVGVWDELSGVESFVHHRVLVEGVKARENTRKRRSR